MTIKIVTDSTCDLPSEYIEKYDITVIPAYINFSEESFLDGVEISRKEFYEKLSTHRVLPTTSSPAIGTFLKAYQTLKDKGASAILSIHPSAAITGIFNIAQIASSNFENFIIKPISTGSLSMGTGIVVLAAAKMAQAGKSLDEIMSKVKDVIERTYTYAVLDTLSFLRRSDRVTRFKAILGSMLQIKPVVNIRNDQVGMEAIRTSQAAIQRLLEVLKSLDPLDQLVLLHTNAPDKVNSLRELIASKYPNIIAPFSMDVTPLIGTHLGPGAVGFTVLKSPS